MAKTPEDLSFEVVNKPSSDMVAVRMKCNKTGATDRVVMMKSLVSDARIAEAKREMRRGYDIRVLLKDVKLA